MQEVSQAYIDSMKQPFLNRGYIKGSIGIINSEAQESATVQDVGQIYFSNDTDIFNAKSISKPYVTCEQYWSKVDSTMYFAPEQDSSADIYYQGLVLEGNTGTIVIDLNTDEPQDIKGLTMNLYGLLFTDSVAHISMSVTTDDGTTKTYEPQDSSHGSECYFSTQDVFSNVTKLTLKFTTLDNTTWWSRPRISSMSFGVVDSFDDERVISYKFNQYVSSTSESLPSKDVTLVLDNQDGYYDMDNDTSAVGFLELGQELKVSIGYDVTGEGNIEWLPETVSYLSSWSATDTEVSFSCTDLFDNNDVEYYQRFSVGNNAYDVAIDILNVMGVASEDYYVDPYLKSVTLDADIPPSKCTEALQLVANACRATLSEDRKGRVHIQSSFVGEQAFTSTTEATSPISYLQNIKNDTSKVLYSIQTNDQIQANGTTLFNGDTTWNTNVGFVSSGISNASCTFDVSPEITINIENQTTLYGLNIKFHNTYPDKVKVATYYEGTLLKEKTYTIDRLDFYSNDTFNGIDKATFTFISTTEPYQRVLIDYLGFGDVVNYELKREYFTESPVTTREDKLKSISVVKNVWTLVDSVQELKKEEIDVTQDGQTYTFYFDEPSKDYSFSFSEETSTSIKLEYVESMSGSYHATVKFSNVTTASTVTVIVSGKLWSVSEVPVSYTYGTSGTVLEWNNPLISTDATAKEVADWLADYYTGRVDYQISWRGDPRVDANDLFYYERKDGTMSTIRAYESDFEFDGSFSGKLNARAVNI